MPPKKEENSCGKCNKAVKEGIQCEICDSWWHPTCAGIETEICECLGKNQQLHWYCMKCNSSVGKLMKEMLTVQNRMDAAEDCIRKMDEKMEKFKEGIYKKLDTVCAEVTQKAKDSLKEIEVKHIIADEIKKYERLSSENSPKWSEIVTKEVDCRFTEISGDLNKVQKSVTETKERILENEDKLKRSNNIIMYNVVESSADSVIERNKEDVLFCGELMEKVLKVGYEEGEIVKVVRLGKVVENNKKRPLLVEFSSGHVKNVVMGNVTNLSSARNEFAGVTISHDMTIKEREQCRKLVEEAKKMQSEDSGNYTYRVRGPPGQMKIVKFRKG